MTRKRKAKKPLTKKALKAVKGGQRSMVRSLTVTFDGLAT